MIIASRDVIFPEEQRAANLVLEGGKICEIRPYSPQDADHDYTGKSILPGVIDPHVHFNEPGRTHWEGWETGTKAALAGGVTSVVEMPLNSIPSTVCQDSLRLKTDSMLGKLYCEVGLWGGAVPGNAPQLKELVKGGVMGLKCFLSDPGTEEFRNLERDSLEEAMKAIAALDSVLLVHAEWPCALKTAPAGVNSHDYSSWLDTRPVDAEAEAIRQVIELSEKTGCRCHIVHVASHEVLSLFEGTDVTCETCAHYLSFSAEEIAPKQTQFKCAPPIRAKDHREGLWAALKSGQIQMVTSDHSPCPPELKNEDFLQSWGGIAGVQMLLTATWHGARQRGFSLLDIARLLSSAPAKLCGLQDTHGSIAVGKTANLVVFEPETEFFVDTLHHRHQGSPYQGRNWTGRVAATILGGALAYQEGQFFGPRGRFLDSRS